MSTKLWLPGLKIFWTTISPFVLLRPVGTKGEMAKRLPQLTGWLTRELLTGSIWGNGHAYLVDWNELSHCIASIGRKQFCIAVAWFQLPHYYHFAITIIIITIAIVIIITIIIFFTTIIIINKYFGVFVLNESIFLV